MRYQLQILFLSAVMINILFMSCVDENISNISESVEINSSYSIPIGDVSYSINDYFAMLDSLQLDTLQIDTMQIDTLQPLFPDTVEFNDTLYRNVKYAVDTTIFRDFDFSTLGNDLEKIRAITFILIIDNDFPTETRTQVYFADESRNLIDSLFSDGPLVIFTPDLDGDGIPVEHPPDIETYPVSDYLIENLADIRNIIIYGYVKTIRPDVNISKFYSDYDLYIHIGARIELEFNTSDF